MRSCYSAAPLTVVKYTVRNSRKDSTAADARTDLPTMPRSPVSARIWRVNLSVRATVWDERANGLSYRYERVDSRNEPGR